MYTTERNVAHATFRQDRRRPGLQGNYMCRREDPELPPPVHDSYTQLQHLWLEVTSNQIECNGLRVSGIRARRPVRRNDIMHRPRTERPRWSKAHRLTSVLLVETCHQQR